MTDFAWVYRSYGRPEEVLRWEPVPEGEGVRVRMLAAPVLPMDRLQIRGLYPWPVELPAVAGAAGCGVVEEGPRRGTKVLLPIRAGTWRTGGRWPWEALAPVPDEVEPLAASLLVVNGLTALDLVEGLQPGDVLVQSPGGSVGRLVDQLCTARGVRCVTLLRRPGEGWQEGVTELPRLLATRALDGVGGEVTERLGACVRDGGVVWHYGAMSRQSPRLAVADLLFRGVRLEGYWLRRVARSPEQRAASLMALARLPPRRGQTPICTLFGQGGTWSEMIAE